MEAPDRRAAWGQWLAQYRARLREQGLPDTERRCSQDAVNPCYVPRNHLMQSAILAAEQQDFNEVSPVGFLKLNPLSKIMSWSSHEGGRLPNCHILLRVLQTREKQCLIEDF